MNSLIIGSGSQVGKILWKRIGGKGFNHQDYDLKGDPSTLPPAEVVYILAGKTRFRDCELDEDAWEVNVDGPIKIGAFYSGKIHDHKGLFPFPAKLIVYVSSEASTWGRTSYGIQKSHAEMGLLSVCGYERLSIVRPKKLTPERIEPFCEFLEKIGKEKMCGIHHF